MIVRLCTFISNTETVRCEVSDEGSRRPARPARKKAPQADTRAAALAQAELATLDRRGTFRAFLKQTMRFSVEDSVVAN